MTIDFEDVVELGADGFGPIASGRRGGRTFAIRKLAGVTRKAIPDAVVHRLANPPHPAILPVDLAATPGGVVMAAPLEGKLLSTLAKRGGAVVSASQAAEIGVQLADAARAVAALGLRLGPLTWHDVYLDADRPGHAWIFPMWAARVRSADWLRCAPADLWFVDREVLRQATPTARSDMHALGALLLVLAHGANAFPRFEGDSALFIRTAVLHGLAVRERDVPDGPLAAAIRGALGREPFDAAALARALGETKGAADPMQQAMALYRDGKSLDAMKVLHRAILGGGAVLPLQILKARIELDQRLVDRALRTLREARDANPHSKVVLALLGEHAPDGLEAAQYLAKAIEVDPLDFELHVGRARALERAGKLDEALDVLDEVRSAGALDPSRARAVARAAVRMGRILIDTRGSSPAAMGIVRPYIDDEDAELRAEALAVEGAAHAQLGAFHQAEEILRAALEVERGVRPTTPRPFVLNQLAHALVATGKAGEARQLVRLSLDQDPGQENLWRLLAALGG